jgi:hypothetical protein
MQASVHRSCRRSGIRAFLVSRRARLTPDDVGLRAIDARPQRVPGLRREEVAQLAGVSVDYYTQLERSDLDGASDSVLNAVVLALRLDDAERIHLFDLARPVSYMTASGTLGRSSGWVQAALVLGARMTMTHVPARLTSPRTTTRELSRGVPPVGVKRAVSTTVR